jgi:DNA gyrase subunit A
MEILAGDAQILTTTERGYGKRTPLDDYRPQKRGGQGIINIRANERNGPVIGIAQVVDDDDVMLITDGGQVLRCPVGGISSMGRATQGVRVMRLATDEKLVSIARLAEEDIAEDSGPFTEGEFPSSDVSDEVEGAAAENADDGDAAESDNNSSADDLPEDE